MKKNYTRILAAGVALVCASTFPVFADFDIDNISYRPMSDDTCIVVFGSPLNTGEVVIPETVTDPDDGKKYTVVGIGSYAFEDCTSMTAIQLPPTIEVIDTRAFYFCSGLTSITLPASLNDISFHVFAYCTNLESINVAEGNEYFKSIDGVLYDKAGEVLVMSPENNTTHLTVPDGVKEIGYGALYNNTILESVTLPEGVVKITTGAFQQCESLRTINCPSTVEYIGGWAFDRCSSLEEFTAGAALKTIDSASFEYCTSLHSFKGSNVLEYVGEAAFMGATVLKSVYLGKSIDWIGYDAFSSSEELEEVIILNPTAPEIAEDAFSDEQYARTTLYLDAAAIPSFEAATPWNYFKTILPYEYTGVKATEANATFEVTTDGGVLNVSSDSEILLFTADGRLLNRADRTLTTAPGKGIYVVKTAGQTVKVLL